jgi:hypothetical protein
MDTAMFTSPLLNHAYFSKIGNFLFTLFKKIKLQNMGGCSVPLCTNRTEKGVKMRKCPKELSRLKLWHQYLRENNFDWNLPKNFVICEIHFGLEQLTDGTIVPEKDPSVPRSVWLQVSN